MEWKKERVMIEWNKEIERDDRMTDRERGIMGRLRKTVSHVTMSWAKRKFRKDFRFYFFRVTSPNPRNGIYSLLEDELNAFEYNRCHKQI